MHLLSRRRPDHVLLQCSARRVVRGRGCVGVCVCADECVQDVERETAPQRECAGRLLPELMECMCEQDVTGQRK